MAEGLMYLALSAMVVAGIAALIAVGTAYVAGGLKPYRIHQAHKHASAAYERIRRNATADRSQKTPLHVRIARKAWDSYRGLTISLVLSGLACAGWASITALTAEHPEPVPGVGSEILGPPGATQGFSEERLNEDLRDWADKRHIGAPGSDGIDYPAPRLHGR